MKRLKLPWCFSYIGKSEISNGASSPNNLVNERGTVVAQAVIRSRSMTFNGIGYFRGGSERVRLGAYGQKRRPIRTANFLEVEGQINLTGVPVNTTSVEIDFSRTRKGSFLQNLAGIIKGIEFSGSGEQTWEKFQSGDVKLLKISVDFGDLRNAANRSALNDLKFLRKARIASDVFIVAEASFAERFNRTQSGQVTAARESIEVTFGGSGSQTGGSTVTLERGMTFAYLLATPQWDRGNAWAFRRRRRRITNLNIDQHGNAELV